MPDETAPPTPVPSVPPSPPQSGGMVVPLLPGGPPDTVQEAAQAAVGALTVALTEQRGNPLPWLTTRDLAAQQRLTVGVFLVLKSVVVDAVLAQVLAGGPDGREYLRKLGVRMAAAAGASTARAEGRDAHPSAGGGS